MKGLKGLCIALILIMAVVLLNGKTLLRKYVFPYKHQEIIQKYSKEYDIDPLLVLSIIKAESKFNPSAKSHKDAYGLMQITDETGKWIASRMNLSGYTKDKLYDEDYNIKMGCWYIKDLKEEFQDDDLVIAAYNAGRGNVSKWLQNKNYSDDNKKLNTIPYKETREYLDRVKLYYKVYSFLYK